MSETKRDYYEILGIEKDADDSDIKKAFRKLAKKYHPDRNPDKNAAKIFAEVNEAYEVLSDPEKRANYDKFGHDGIDGDGLGFDAEEVFSSFFDTIKQGGAFDNLDFDSEPGSEKNNKKSKKNKKNQDDEVSFDDYLKEETKEEKTKKRWSFFGKFKKDEKHKDTADIKDESQSDSKHDQQNEQIEINEPRFDANIDEEVISKNNDNDDINFESNLNETKDVDDINFESDLENVVKEEPKEDSNQGETEYWEQFVGNQDYGYYDENNDWQWKGYFNDNQEWIPINDEENADLKNESVGEESENINDSEKTSETVVKLDDENKENLSQETVKEEKEQEIPKSSSISSSTSSFDLSFLFNKPKTTDENEENKLDKKEVVQEEANTSESEIKTDQKVDNEDEKETKDLSDIDLEMNEAEDQTPTEEITSKEIEEIIDIPPTDNEEEVEDKFEETKDLTTEQKTDELESEKELITPEEDADQFIDKKTTSEVQSEIAEKMKIAPLDEIELSTKEESENKVDDSDFDFNSIRKSKKERQQNNKHNVNKTIIFEDDNFSDKNQDYKTTEELLKSTFGKDGIDSVLNSDELIDNNQNIANKKVPIIEAVETDKNKKQDYNLSDAHSELLDEQQEFALQINKQTDIDIVYQANVHQLLLFNNAIKRIAYYRHIPCEVCDATGADLSFKNKAIKVCQVCKNNSKEVENCKTCNGFGRLITKPCKQCKGKSYCKEQIVLDIKLPITTNLCLEVTYPGFGHIISKEIKGDFKVIFNVIESKFFKARGNNIWTLALIDPAVAAVGGWILVPTLNKLIELKINGGVMSGDELVIKKMGLPPRYDSTIDKHFNKQGDLIIKIKYADVNKVNPKVSVQELAKQQNAHVNKYNSLVKNELSCLDNNAQLLKTIEPKLDKKETKNNEFEWIKNYKFVETKVDQPQSSDKKHKQINKNKKSTSKADSSLNKKNKAKPKQRKTKAIDDKPTKKITKTKTITKTNKSKK